MTMRTKQQISYASFSSGFFQRAPNSIGRRSQNRARSLPLDDAAKSYKTGERGQGNLGNQGAQSEPLRHKYAHAIPLHAVGRLYQSLPGAFKSRTPAVRLARVSNSTENVCGSTKRSNGKQLNERHQSGPSGDVSPGHATLPFGRF